MSAKEPKRESAKEIGKEKLGAEGETEEVF